MKVTTDACLFGAWVAQEVKNEKLKVESVLDIGTGTGLLSFMLAQKNDDALMIHAIEIDKDAADQAKENAISSPWKERIDIINADVDDFSFVNKYDLIISNPPFYENELRSGSERKNIAHHSENLTLKELLNIIKNNLNRDGCFFLLLPYKRNDEIKRLLKDQQLYVSKILFVRQSIKHDYFRIFVKGDLKTSVPQEIEFHEISIWDENQQYTQAFIDLLKDYYLYL
jgi:tRNA1Val (adenine37-N6)-methyltransferase